MIEEWRPIEDYEGYYEVSNLGQVRSLDRFSTNTQGYTRMLKGKILKQKINYGRNGYSRYMVDLFKFGKGKTFKVSKLVANAFIPKDDLNYIYVLHGPNGSLDNNVSNLSWGTSKMNFEDMRYRDKTDYRLKITHCPYGAPYIDRNIQPSKKAKNNRGCLACNRVYGYIARNGGDNFQEIHDMCFEHDTTPGKLKNLGLI